MRQNQHAEALQRYGNLAGQFPGLGSLWDEYGKAAAAAGDYTLADQIWQRILDNGPKSAALLLRLAGEYGQAWQFSRARELSRQAAELEPNNLQAQVNLASLLARTGGVDEARPAVNHCARLDPRNEQARCLAAHLDRRENKLVEAEQQFRDLLGSSLRDPFAVSFCHYELARVLDRMDRFDEAIASLEEGKKVTAQSLDVESGRQVFDERRFRMVRKAQALPKNILQTWCQQFPEKARFPVPSLAFLGGHARSGTTLLERILDAHPAVVALDEALAFKTIGPLVDVTLPEIPAEHLNLVRERYLKNLTITVESSPAGKTLIDKNPSVTAYLPAFLRAFPELRVVIALRDPRDVLVSCYFEDVPQVSHLSFEGLAQLYTSVMGVWLAVREWTGLNWTETRYESIVADLEAEGRRVTHFLGLEWDPGQAAFHEKNREKPIMSTTNYSNVTKPVYARSVGRWQSYEKHLAPVLPMLGPFLKEFGYAA